MSWAVYFIVVPLFFAFLILAASTLLRKWAGHLAFLVSGALGLTAIAALPRVTDGHAYPVILGGWAPPFGINLYVDALSLGMVAVVATMITVGIMYQIMEGLRKAPYFYGLALLLLGSLSGMILTGDAFNFFVFMEISGMATYGLIAASPNRAAPRGAFKYLVLAGAASVFFLVGIAIVYRTLGTLNMADIARHVPMMAGGVTLAAYVAFMIPLLLEAEAFPLNAWVPDAYKGAPSMVSGLLSSAVGVASAYALIRFSNFMFGVDGLASVMGGIKVGHMLLGVGILTVLFGEMAALAQDDAKKLLAWSSVGQMGLVIVALSFGSAFALHAALFLIVSHAFAKMLLFLSVGSIIRTTGTSRWREWKGVGRRNPILVSMMLVGVLAILGIPLFSGFWGKFELVGASVNHGLLGVWGMGAVLGGSVIEAGYFFRMIHTMFEEPEGDYVRVRAGFGFWVAALSLVAAIMVMGLYPKPFSSYFKHAVAGHNSYGQVMKKVLADVNTPRRVR